MPACLYVLVLVRLRKRKLTGETVFMFVLLHLERIQIGAVHRTALNVSDYAKFGELNLSIKIGYVQFAVQ